MGAFARQRVRMRNAPVGAALAFAAMLMLSGCSSLQVMYTLGGNMLESRADTYLDLSAEQKLAVAAQAEALIAWHRRDMLPKYAAFLRQQADIAEAGGWTRPQMAAAFAAVRGLLDETVDGAAPFIAAVLVEHTAPEKHAHLAARMAEHAAERRERNEDETLEESLAEWVEHRADRISRFTGYLDDAQMAIIRRHAEGDVDRTNRWIDNREKRGQAFLAFLAGGPSRDEIARFVHRIVLDAHEIVDPDYRAISESRWARREALYFEVLSTLSDDQRRELVETLRGYADDMVELAGV